MPASIRRERVYLVRVWTQSTLPDQLRGTVTDVETGAVRYITQLHQILDVVKAPTRNPEGDP